jgi:hypothetical protein
MNGLRGLSFALPLCAALVSSTAFAAGGQNSGGLAPFILLPGGGAADNHGHFVCTAAITAGGGVSSGEYVNAALTSRISAGTYQVAFNAPCPNVQIANGWFRIAQPDTLGTGTLPARSCIVADRFGVPSAVWVQCFNNAGALTDTSFTLHVSR